MFGISKETIGEWFMYLCKVHKTLSRVADEWKLHYGFILWILFNMSVLFPAKIYKKKRFIQSCWIYFIIKFILSHWCKKKTGKQDINTDNTEKDFVSKDKGH